MATRRTQDAYGSSWVVHGHVISVSTRGRDKGGLLQLVSGHFPSPDMCLPVAVLEKGFTAQTLAATALAVYK